MLVTTNMGKKTQKTNMGSTIAQESGEELQFSKRGWSNHGGPGSEKDSPLLLSLAYPLEEE